MPVITFASSKGGAGKTMSAIVLATTLARNYQVTLIDAAPDQHLMFWSKKAPLPDQLKVHGTKGERFIQDEIKEAVARSEFVIVDLESAVTRLNSYAMGGSDLVIIPMGDEQQDAEAILETLSQLQVEEKIQRRQIMRRILFVRSRTAKGSGPLAAPISTQADTFTMQLTDLAVLALLRDHGGTLYSMDPGKTSGVARAIGNTELLVEEVLGLFPEELKRESRRRRETYQTVQMSVRMPEETYEQFRLLCQKERRTNGDMLRVLMESYIARGAPAK